MLMILFPGITARGGDGLTTDPDLMEVAKAYTKWVKSLRSDGVERIIVFPRSLHVSGKRVMVSNEMADLSLDDLNQFIAYLEKPTQVTVFEKVYHLEMVALVGVLAERRAPGAGWME